MCNAFKELEAEWMERGKTKALNMVSNKALNKVLSKIYPIKWT